MDAGDRERHNLEGLKDVEVTATGELGRIEVTTAQLRTLQVGDVLTVGRHCGPIEVRVNDVAIGMAETCVYNEMRSLRVTRLNDVAGDRREG